MLRRLWRRLVTSRRRAVAGATAAVSPALSPPARLPVCRCSPPAGKPPAPRAAHTAAVYRERWLLVFGGGSVAHCNNELHVLDLLTLEWSQPEAEGPVPPPRAGAPLPLPCCAARGQHVNNELATVWIPTGVHRIDCDPPS